MVPVHLYLYKGLSSIWPGMSVSYTGSWMKHPQYELETKEACWHCPLLRRFSSRNVTLSFWCPPQRGTHPLTLLTVGPQDGISWGAQTTKTELRIHVCPSPGLWWEVHTQGELKLVGSRMRLQMFRVRMTINTFSFPQIHQVLLFKIIFISGKQTHILFPRLQIDYHLGNDNTLSG